MKTNGPLDGLRVIDLSGMISGGFATMMLADFGADVVMVEHPDHGDPIRNWAPFVDETSLWWKSIARNKRCVTLDLSTDDGRALALELISDADVVFENFRPGTMERWELDYDVLRETNEGIILVRLSGFGQTGPYADRAGFGTVAEGFTGWAHVNGFPDREPLLPPISLADLTAAQFAVQATMFAIFERNIGTDGGSNKGQVIDVSLYEPLFRLFISEVEQYHKHETFRRRTGNRHPSAAPRNIYETADGHITLSASSQNIFENVAVAIDRTDLIDDHRFKSNAKRVENVENLDEAIENWTRDHSTEKVLEIMERHDTVVGPVYNMADIFEHEQYQARNNLVEIDDDDVGSLKMAGVVPKFSRTPGSVSHAGPHQGEHNESVYLDELGLSRKTLDRLCEQKIV